MTCIFSVCCIFLGRKDSKLWRVVRRRHDDDCDDDDDVDDNDYHCYSFFFLFC